MESHASEETDVSPSAATCTQQFTQPKVEPLDDGFYDNISEGDFSPEMERALCEALDSAERQKIESSPSEDDKSPARSQTNSTSSISSNQASSAISSSPEFDIPVDDELAFCAALDAMTAKKNQSKRPLAIANIEDGGRHNLAEQKNSKHSRKAVGSSQLLVKKSLKGYFNSLSPGKITKTAGEMIDWCYIRVGLIDRLYKRHEVWTCNVGKNKAELQGYFFKIGGFGYNARRKAAVCPPGNVLVTLKRTFIGEEEANRLAKAQPEFAKALVWVNTSTMLSPGANMIQLAQLDEEELAFDSSTEWECDMVNDTLSAGYNIAYQLRSRHFLPIRGLLKRKPVCLDLFAGAGGMSHGLRKAQFDVKYLVENDPFAAATLRINIECDGAQVYEEDVSIFLQKMESGDPCYPQRGDVDLVHASPPCQGHSRANRTGGRNDTINNIQSLKLLRAVTILLPPFAIFENVNGILLDETGKIKISTTLQCCLEDPIDAQKLPSKHYIQRLAAGLLLLGYQVRITILNAAHYGDPQSRERVILFAALKSWKLPDVPPPTHGDARVSPNLKPFVTALDVLGDLEYVEPVRGSGLVMLPNKTMITHHNIENTQPKSEFQQLIAEDTAPTVRTSNSIMHYSHRRDLTIRERARMQSFPDSHVFCGSHTQRKHQIGNAVPINLATAIAKSVMNSFYLKSVAEPTNGGRVTLD